MKNNSSKTNTKRTGKRRLMVAVICAAVSVAIGTIAVFAYLSGKSGSVNNTLTADPDPTIAIQETVSGDTKSDVYFVVNNAGYTVYVRAAIVVTWADGNGNVLATKPVEGTDYDITYANVVSTSSLAAEKWTLGSDGFYYYSSPVGSEAPNNQTQKLIETAKLKDGVTPPEGYSLSIEIVAQTVQAIGTTDTDDVLAVEDAWGVDVDNNGLISKSA